MVNCKNCGKGRPTLFNKDGGFCNQACYDEFKTKDILADDLLTSEFHTKVIQKRTQNVIKHGFQDRETIFEGLVEEVGEIARALLNRYKGNQIKDGRLDLRKECIDTAAVLLEIWLRADIYTREV